MLLKVNPIEKYKINNFNIKINTLYLYIKYNILNLQVFYLFKSKFK